MRYLQFKVGELPSQLAHQIKTYNQIDEMNDLERLFYLQKINYFMEKEYTNPAVIAWRAQLGPGGFGAHLHFYGIHRDASPFMQDIEFAHAVARYSGENPEKLPVPQFFSALKRSKELVQEELRDTVIRDYQEANRAIKTHYETDASLREKVESLEKSAALSSVKSDAVLKELETTATKAPFSSNESSELIQSRASPKPSQTPIDSTQTIKKALMGARDDEPESHSQKGITK